MGKVHEQIDAALEEFIRTQQMFFVATAPLNEKGHVNVSPKGRDTLRVLACLECPVDVRRAFADFFRTRR